MKKRWRKFGKSHSPCLKIYSQMRADEWNFTPWAALYTDNPLCVVSNALYRLALSYCNLSGGSEHIFFNKGGYLQMAHSAFSRHVSRTHSKMLFYPRNHSCQGFKSYNTFHETLGNMLFMITKILFHSDQILYMCENEQLKKKEVHFILIVTASHTLSFPETLSNMVVMWSTVANESST